MIRRVLSKIFRPLINGLVGFWNTILVVIFKRDKKKPEEEVPWWETDETEPEDKKVDKKVKKPSFRMRIKKVKNRFTTGPRPLPGPRRAKRIIASILFLIYIGIIIFIVRQNVYVGIFFMLTAYTILDYLAMTRDEDIWGDKS